MARLNLDLTDTQSELVERLMKMCDLRSKTDVVENGLILLGWAAREVQHGLTIAAVDETQKIYREVQTPALEGARRVGEKRAAAESEPLAVKAKFDREAFTVTAVSAESRSRKRGREVAS